MRVPIKVSTRALLGVPSIKVSKGVAFKGLGLGGLYTV